MQKPFIFVLLFIAMAGLSACQKNEQTNKPAVKVNGQSIPIPEQLSALDMYHFKELVKAPDFELPSTEGKNLKLSQYRGKVVLLSFWTTWWRYCRKEFPSLKNLNQHFKGKPFTILAIDLREKKSLVTRYVRDNGLTYTNLIDETGKVSGQYGVSSTPVKFLIDAEGNMVGAAMGYREWDSDEVKALIETVMNTKE